ncbi:fatty-acyl-CoA synthase [Sulfobacillus thermosulfidooxidans DSM 9293]|uniref:Fatty-acyl-CoA synthase n=2 Tax=Sulfobacillus thermosulfidooxidans TaxID=28034 RepID=A0A1W1WLY5_SULTA|nr:long-chain-fatty-acid--CoA ligase [Sulfobacillus thermosulfidooxidans]PSR29785.1 MAG: O-succinylbenzoate--CoA ligase [Sulfobacillus thermosulfidooxidans]SMC07189.1 fatty-acyl-CoA synthase [Sulfobacillus thermosulfidooxidans DSM 9293]
MEVPMLPMRFLHRARSLYPRKTAIICHQVEETYEDFSQRVNQLSRALHRVGVKQGDRVAYLALNCHRMIEGYYGVPQIGAILLCLNIRLHPEEIAFIINDATPKVLVVSPQLLPLWTAIQDKCPSVQHVWLMEPSPSPSPFPTYDDMLACESPDAPEVPVINENDVAELFYTSGTTGSPKGVMMTYRNLYAHALSTLATVNFNDEVIQIVGTVPLFHVNGWGSPHYLVAVGATQVVVPRFDPELFGEAVQRTRATHALLVPTMLNSLLNSPAVEHYDFSSLQQILLGGAATAYSLIEEARNRLECECIVGYGLTETCPIVSIAYVKSSLKTLPRSEQNRLQSLTGLPAVGIDVEIFDSSGQPLPHDGQHPGELGVRADSVMKGYWNRPEDTAKAFHNGWFLTGDVAVIDSEGYINIVDRKKDIVISGGENISSLHVEDVLYAHPDILEAAVIGIPDPKWGEIPHAIVVPKAGHNISLDQLQAFCRERLGGFEVPKSWEIAESLPKTGTGKIMKHILREKFRSPSRS